jgi:mono/diheme cytochrome c family protein
MRVLRKFNAMAIVGAVMIAVPAVAFAATSMDDAKRDFETACASCHGLTGKGDGPLKDELKTRPTDLTALAKNNNGVFPSERASQVVDGRQEVKAHGSREMPVWGNSFRLRDAGPSPASRIKALTEYLKSIQVK